MFHMIDRVLVAGWRALSPGRFCFQESILTFCKTKEVNRVSPHLSEKIQVNGASPRLPCVCPAIARVGWLGFTSMVFKHVVLSRALVG